MTLAVDQKELKACLSVLLKERRYDRRKSLSDVASRCGLPEALLGGLEANESFEDVDTDLMKALMQGYDLSDTEVNEVVRVACVSRLLHVIKAFENIADD